MGTASKILSVAFRVWELICSAIVLGIMSRFIWAIRQSPLHSPNSRIVYAETVAALGIFFSLILILPMAYSFYAFPLDLSMFIMWMVSFSLLANRSSSCDSTWFWNYWGYYWGRWWRVGPPSLTLVGRSGCGQWRAMLAFSFMASMTFLASFCISLYCLSRRREKQAMRSSDVPAESSASHWYSGKKRTDQATPEVSVQAPV